MVGFVIRRGLVVAIENGFVGNSVRIVFRDEVIGIHRRHVVVMGTSVDKGNSVVGDRKDSPGAAVDATARIKGHEEVIAAAVTGGVCGDGTHGTGLGIVGSAIIHLDVGTEFKFHSRKIRFWGAKNDTCGR